MQGKHDKDWGGRNAMLWSFLVIGAVALVAGIFMRIPGAPESLSKAEILTGAFFLFGAISALLIAG